jgi:hypothetical protein
MVATYFFLVPFWVVVALFAGANVVAQIGPPAYGEAAELVPLVGLGFIAHGWFVVLYRVSQFPGRLRAYASLNVLSAVAIIGSALVLVPHDGAFGAAAALVAGPLLAGSVMLTLSQEGPKPIPYPYRRIAGAAAIAVALVVAEFLIGSQVGSWRPGVGVLALIAYPVLLLATGIVSPEHKEALRRLLVPVVASRARTRAAERVLAGADPSELVLLEQLIRRRRPLAEVAEERASSDGKIAEDLLRILRRGTGTSGPEGADPEVGRYLVSTDPIAQRDSVARALWSLGADPLEVEVLASLIKALRRLPRRSWPATAQL